MKDYNIIKKEELREDFINEILLDHSFITASNEEKVIKLLLFIKYKINTGISVEVKVKEMRETE